MTAAAAGSVTFTAEHLEEMGPLAIPLLPSPLVGEVAAWAAIRAMAAALPGGLGTAATAVATALRLVALQTATGTSTPVLGLRNTVICQKGSTMQMRVAACQHTFG